jgi:hypothetical protein
MRLVTKIYPFMSPLQKGGFDGRKRKPALKT